LIETVNGLEARGVSFRSLTEAIDTTTPGGRLIFRSLVQPYSIGHETRLCARKSAAVYVFGERPFC
jgi:hypothetical protein